MIKLILYLHTIRHLKFTQVYYRIYYSLRKRLRKPKLNFYSMEERYSYKLLSFTNGINPKETYNNGWFTFLNQKIKLTPTSFEQNELEKLDWNFMDYGKLWNYHLNYFDYLLQSTMTKETGLELIHNFISQSKSHTFGLEPYPTSLRINNWIKFIFRHSIEDYVIIASLHDQCELLAKNIEYHLLGNHILENGFSLYTAGLFFYESNFNENGLQILLTQLNEQILADGGHFEHSPMYHSIILNRLLDVINILQNNQSSNQKFTEFLKEKATKMITWLMKMTFSSGKNPLFNDSAMNIAPSTQQIIDYATRLLIPIEQSDLDKISTSGYRRYNSDFYEIIIDVGEVGPRYIPGHAHSDMLTFELYLGEEPLMVDTGISTYAPGYTRCLERSTAAHNTVTIDNLNQSEMWASHRVARRAKIIILNDSYESIEAEVIGFPPIWAKHRRLFCFDNTSIKVIDKVSSHSNKIAKAYFHFYPGIVPLVKDEIVLCGNCQIHFDGQKSIKVIDYNYSPEFNIQVSAKALEVCFTNSLISILNIMTLKQNE